MDVFFTTTDFGDEAASRAAAGGGRPPSEDDHLFGHVVIEQPDQPTLRIFDDLPFLAQSLCADAPRAVRRSGSAEVRLMEWENTLTLTLEGAVVLVTGTEGEAARYPADAFLAALQDCGGRFAAFLGLVVQTAPQFGTRLEWLEAALRDDAAAAV